MKKLKCLLFFVAIMFVSFSENYTELGNLEYKKGNYKEAIKYYKKSGSDEANFMTGVTLQMQASYNPKSRSYFKKAITDGYKVYESYYYLGRSYIEWKKLHEPDKNSKLASEYLTKALEGYDNGKVYYELGYLNRSIMNTRKAEEYYQKSYENGNVESLCRLLSVYADLLVPPVKLSELSGLNKSEYNERKKRDDFFEERYERRRADFTTEEINEKITMVKMEIRKSGYNCQLLDYTKINKN